MSKDQALFSSNYLRVSNIQALFDLLEVGPWLSVCKTRLNVQEKFDPYKFLNVDVEAQYGQMSGSGGVHTKSATRCA